MPLNSRDTRARARSRSRSGRCRACRGLRRRAVVWLCEVVCCMVVWLYGCARVCCACATLQCYIHTATAHAAKRHATAARGTLRPRQLASWSSLSSPLRLTWCDACLLRRDIPLPAVCLPACLPAPPTPPCPAPPGLPRRPCPQVIPDRAYMLEGLGPGRSSHAGLWKVGLLGTAVLPHSRNAIPQCTAEACRP